MTILTNSEIEVLSSTEYPDVGTTTGNEPTFLESIHDLEDELISGIDVA